MNTLIAWFSWSGNTRDIAERIARKTRGELFRIEREVPYSTDYSTCAYREAKEEADKQLRPAIKGPLPDIAVAWQAAVCVRQLLHRRQEPVYERYGRGNGMREWRGCASWSIQ